MKYLLSIIVLLTGISTAISPAYGQTWSKKQLEVLKFIDTVFKASMEKEDWVTTYVHEDALVWNNGQPMPRDKSSIQKWNRYGNENSTGLLYELYPVGIIVHDNTAIAHYFYSVAFEDRKEERKTVHGHYTDILVKEKGKWRFLGWNGGDDPTDD